MVQPPRRRSRAIKCHEGVREGLPATSSPDAIALQLEVCRVTRRGMGGRHPFFRADPARLVDWPVSVEPVGAGCPRPPPGCYHR